MAERKMRWTKELIAKAGMDPVRLRLEWISASEGQRFANTVKEFTDQIRELGPMKGKDREKISKELEAVCNTVSETRVRVIMGKEKELVEEGNVYGEKLPQEEFDSMMNDILENERIREKILLLAKGKPLSVKEMAEKMKMPPNKVGGHVMWLRYKGKISLHSKKGRSPLYRTVEVRG